MKMDLDKLSIELAESMADTSALDKAIPPKLYYRMRAWLKKLKPEQQPQAANMVARKYEEEVVRTNLAKSDVMASVYGGGEIRFDFGSEVPDKTKKAAMDWAKRRGLRAIEASLAKSDGSPQTYLFGPQATSAGLPCVKRLRWSI